MGKGSNPRPYSIPREEFRNNWDQIFGSKEPQTNQADQQDKSNQPDKKDAKYNDNKG